MTEQIIAALIERVNQLERENIQLAKRIERLEAIATCEADTAEEWYEEQLDKAATHCARCGDELSAISWSCGVLTDLCPECESELAEEQTTLGGYGCSDDTEVPF